MVLKNHLENVLLLAKKEHPAGDFAFLDHAVFSAPLTQNDQQNFLYLLHLVRKLQAENPVYEPLYHRLLHLFVLNGSRLDLLKTIDRRLRGLIEGQGSLLLISGISGIGKTSLVMSFQERVHQLGAAFITVPCFEQESTSYAVWQNLAHAVADATGKPLDTLLAPIGEGLSASSAYQLTRSLASWLENIASTRPLVILLDDLHWADVDSLEVFNIITSQFVQVPILYIATYRSEEAHSRHPLSAYLPEMQRNRSYSHLHIEPMVIEDVARLVTALHGPCSPQLAAYLYQRAKGQPLFTVELLNDLTAQKRLAQDRNGFWLPPEQSIPIPKVLKQLILQRVNRFGSQVEQLLLAAAVAGESWHLKIVEPLLEMSETEIITALESALRAEIIITEDEQAEVYRFSHGLIREVLYSAQITRRRKQFHEQIAVQFERQQPENVFATAHHFFEGEQWEKAVAYYRLAGEQAIQRLAYHSALKCYQKALNASGRAGKEFDGTSLLIYDRLGRIYRAMEQRDQAEVIYSRIRDLAQSRGGAVAEGRALVNLANVQTLNYKLGLAETTAYEALRIAEQTQDVGLLTDVHACLGSLLLVQGQLDQAEDHYREVMKNAEVVRDSSTLLDTLRLSAYRTIWQAQYSQAETYAREALQLAQKMNDPLAIVGAFQNLSFIQIEMGQYLEAHRNIHTTLEAIEDSGNPHHQKPRLLNLMGYLHLELGDAQTAIQWDQKALEAIHGAQAQSIEMLRYSLLNQATDYMHLGRMDQVQETIAQFEAIQEATEFMKFRYTNRYQLLMAEFSLRQKRYEQAIELAQEARALAQSHGMLKNLARCHWLEGQALTGLMRFTEALHQLETAAALADSIQHGSLRWKTRVSLAAALVKSGGSPDAVIQQARKQVDQTLQSLVGSYLYDTFLASPWVEQLKALEQPSSPEKTIYPAGLTEREVEVLRLVASGATNQQVAEVLHISVRTVNTHMTNILNKTGCENRTAASAFAIQHKLLST